MRRTHWLAVGLILVVGATAWWTKGSRGGDPPGKKEGGDGGVVRIFEAFVAAFDRSDAAALAALWSEDAEYDSRIGGEKIRGRKAIEKDFEGVFARNKGRKLSLAIDSVRKPTGDVALVEGTARVVDADGLTSTSGFHSVLVRRGERWMLDSVREFPVEEPASNLPFLEDLAWLVGDWRYEKDGDKVQIVGYWAADGNFLIRRFQVERDKELVIQGMQIVGWDPLQKKIRSWIFEGDGSFGEGTWEKKEGKWYVRMQGVLPTGERSASTQILEQRGKDRYSWQMVARSVDEVMLPNVEPVVLQRHGIAAAEKEAQR